MICNNKNIHNSWRRKYDEPTIRRFSDSSYDINSNINTKHTTQHSKSILLISSLAHSLTQSITDSLTYSHYVTYLYTHDSSRQFFQTICKTLHLSFQSSVYNNRKCTITKKHHNFSIRSINIICKTNYFIPITCDHHKDSYKLHITTDNNDYWPFCHNNFFSDTFRLSL